jgi:RNA polymerase sigma-70 factor, ECF subfamily
LKDYDALKDFELISLSAEGDEMAFQHLVKRHNRWAYGFVLKTIRNPESAWDITQEAFVRVFKNLTTFRKESSFNTWFHRILYNLCIDHWRKYGRRIHLEYQDYLSFSGAGVSKGIGQHLKDYNPEKNSRRNEVMVLLEKGIESLSLEQRTVLVLREIEGLSYDEISSVIDCPKGTVMSRLHHARKKIISFMKEHGYNSSEI